jgi:zinc protease
MTLLLNILTTGDSSRLHRLLVEEGLTISAGGFQSEGFDPGLVYFYFTLPPEGDANVVEQHVLEALQRVATEGVSEAELAKARNIVLADFWRGLATIEGKADALGHYEVFLGNYEKLFDLPDELDAISADDLRDVAARVFRSSNMTVGTLVQPVEESVE